MATTTTTLNCQGIYDVTVSAWSYFEKHISVNPRCRDGRRSEVISNAAVDVSRELPDVEARGPPDDEGFDAGQ